MSREKQIIEVAPPEYSNYRESSVLSGFKCPRCNGRGWLPDYGIKDIGRMDCERCGGTGRLNATVRIEWVADERELGIRN